MSPNMVSPDLTGLIGSILVILPHEVWFYLLLIATILVWSLHFVLRHIFNRAEPKSE